MNIIAKTKSGRVYTLEPYYELDGHYQRKRHPHLRWKGFCDGQSTGLYRTREEWEHFVDGEPIDPIVTEDQYYAMREESFSTWKGNQILHSLLDNLNRRKVAT